MSNFSGFQRQRFFKLFQVMFPTMCLFHRSIAPTSLSKKNKIKLCLKKCLGQLTTNAKLSQICMTRTGKVIVFMLGHYPYVMRCMVEQCRIFKGHQISHHQRLNVTKNKQGFSQFCEQVWVKKPIHVNYLIWNLEIRILAHLLVNLWKQLTPQLEGSFEKDI